MTRAQGLAGRACIAGCALVMAAASRGGAQVAVPPAQQTDSVTIRIANTDLRTAVQVLGQYLDRPVILSGNTSIQVTLETPRPVPRADVPRMLRGLLDANNFEFVDDTAARVYRARPREQAPRPPGMPFGQPPQQQARGPVELFVIHLKHARAADVASTLNALYGRASGPDVSGRRPTLGDELQRNQVPAVEPPLAQSVQGAAGRSATLTGEITIVPDARANSLLIRANRDDFTLISAAVQEVDIRPLQVLIEVLIAEVRRDRSLSLGVDVTLPETRIKGTNTTIEGGVSGTGTGAPGLGEFVLKVMGIGGVDLDASLRAAAGRGDVAIVSRPVVLTANNEEAEIVVGSQRPFVQVSRALPTDAAVRDQIVQYKEVGTKLIVKPTISRDGSVQLEVVQEVSNATEETAFNAPVISTRSVQTQLLIQDGQTVALGGLTDRQKDVTKNGVPVLSSIPLLGGLFGRQTRRTTETELFVFLTPRVIRTDEDAQRLSRPLRERADRAKP